MDFAAGLLKFTRIIEKRGHRTLRVRSDKPIPQYFQESLVAFGCTYEGANQAFIAIDVPPGMDLSEAVKLLPESGLEWEYADPGYEQLHGGA